LRNVKAFGHRFNNFGGVSYDGFLWFIVGPCQRCNDGQFFFAYEKDHSLVVGSYVAGVVGVRPFDNPVGYRFGYSA
jgi:hypothetical protein